MMLICVITLLGSIHFDRVREDGAIEWTMDNENINIYNVKNDPNFFVDHLVTGAFFFPEASEELGL